MGKVAVNEGFPARQKLTQLPNAWQGDGSVGGIPSHFEASERQLLVWKSHQIDRRLTQSPAYSLLCNPKFLEFRWIASVQIMRLQGRLILAWLS